MFRHLLAAAVLSVLLPTVSAVAENLFDHVRTGGDGSNYVCYAEGANSEHVPISYHDDRDKATGSCGNAKLKTFLGFPVKVNSGEEVLFDYSTVEFYVQETSRTRTILNLTPEAQALLVKYTLALNSPDSTVGAIRTTAFPEGNAPLDSPGASCSEWTTDDIGDSDSEIDCSGTPETTLSFTASSTNTTNPAIAYQTCADTGDCQAKGQIPASYTGYTEDQFASFGSFIREGVADADYFAQCWCPVAGAVRFNHGTPASFDTFVGQAGDCYNKHLVMTYDQSATALACWESTDDTTYTQVGSDVIHTLTCDTDTCPAGIMGTSSDANQTTFATITNADVGTTIDIVEDEDPPPNPENIIWAGDMETGNTLQWPNSSDFGNSFYFGIPQYCRPAKVAGEVDRGSGYYGDGSCLEVVTSPVRQGTYAAKFTVKNSENGTNTSSNNGGDCDGSVCSRRRSELWMHKGVPVHFNGMPYLGERWFSVSHFVPSDWDNSGGGFGPLVLQVKPYNEPGSGGLSPTIAIELKGTDWKIWHRWAPDEGMDRTQMLWQWGMFYRGFENGACYPRASGSAPLWADGVAHFPNEAASCAALQSVNKGGWTDWVFHVKFDARGSDLSGTGFLRVWKREGSGSWVQVLNITPGEVDRGGETFNHGIGYNSPSTGGSNPGGFGPIHGLYMDVDQVWDLPDNRVIVIDNMKVGDENATFADMSPDGSTP